MEVYTQEGAVKVPLAGSWFENGFKGTMGELLCAIEENRRPVHSAENNLQSLALCFAALESATHNRVVVPGDVCGCQTKGCTIYNSKEYLFFSSASNP
jgi:hypothetical protein